MLKCLRNGRITDEVTTCERRQEADALRWQDLVALLHQRYFHPLKAGQKQFSGGRKRCQGLRGRQERAKALGKADRQALIVVQDDAHNLTAYLEDETIDFLVTSSPYWVIHRRPRTADAKEPRPYSDIPQDLGKIFAAAFRVLKPGAYCIVNVMDLRYGSWFIPYHVDILSLLTRQGFRLEDIIIR